MFILFKPLCFSEKQKKMSKKRKNAELPETIEDLKRRNEDLEAEKMSLVARIQELETSNKDFEQEIRQLKENCKCPQVKICFEVNY